VPISPKGWVIRYRCLYLIDIKLKFNFDEIFVAALKKALTTAVVKFIDNYTLQLYI